MSSNCTNLTLCFNGTEIDFDSHGTLSAVFSTVLTVMLALVVFSLGCTVEAQKLWSHLRRPWGIAIGFVCQFGLMPLIAYLLAIGFSVQPTQAVAILIMGCCPGGVISNIITLWVDGDMDLSLSMTSCSTIFALGMMPLCLFIYSRSWELAKSIKIPYYNIGMALLSVVVPVGMGVYVNYKWPRKAKIISKAGSIIGGLLMLVIGVASSVLYKGSWNTDISILTIGIIYPLLGYISGFCMAIVVRQPWQRCRTIALETGAQNVQMCSTVLQLSFTPKQLVQMFTFPLIYASFQFINGMLLVAAYQLYKRKYGNICKEKVVNHSERCIKINELEINGDINPHFEYDEEGVTHVSNSLSSTTGQLSEIATISKDTFL
ncbi:sodium-dependent organic anion transporter isoform X1 [Spea bombifrons]|uniref:sodium-dependent organic anion transporter isoform X1 n=1 Tax=Spea bombifrons TaxID=233779 RepID=UPI00234B9D24|nr:sodium-dependent organic anion transporter isoform X1 [Spea bombifrons]